MKIYLLRHAERGHGEEQDTLTDKGLLQAKELKEKLKKLNIEKIYCSSSYRTKKTIEPFLEEFNGEVIYTPRLEEMRLGVLQGKTASEFREALSKSRLSKDEFRPEGGENLSDFENRVSEFIEELKKEKNKIILISTHAGVIRMFFKFLTDIPKEEIKKQDFASLTLIKL